MKRITRIVFGILALGLARHTYAETLLVPDLPHYLFNGMPFRTSIGDGRYQQIYDSSALASPVLIKSFRFLTDWPGVYNADITIRLGQTEVAVDSLSTDLDENVSGTLTTVFSDSQFSQTVAPGWDLGLVFQFASTPFVYDPTGGENLLLDLLIKNKEFSGSNGLVASRADVNPITARAYDFTTTSGVDGVGLRTRFEFSPVPEPSTLILLTCVVLVAFLCRWRKHETPIARI